MVEEWKRIENILIKRGYSRNRVAKEIGNEYGFSRYTIYLHLNPDVKKKIKEGGSGRRAAYGILYDHLEEVLSDAFRGEDELSIEDITRRLSELPEVTFNPNPKTVRRHLDALIELYTTSGYPRGPPVYRTAEGYRINRSFIKPPVRPSSGIQWISCTRGSAET